MNNEKLVKLNFKDIATILAALRLFQKEYRDKDSDVIREDWPDHFEGVMPLGSDDISTLCERIIESLPRNTHTQPNGGTVRSSQLSRKQRFASCCFGMLPVTAISTMLYYYGFENRAFVFEIIAITLYAVWVFRGALEE